MLFSLPVIALCFVTFDMKLNLSFQLSYSKINMNITSETTLKETVKITEMNHISWNHSIRRQWNSSWTLSHSYITGNHSVTVNLVVG